jgi:hypothetical protein
VPTTPTLTLCDKLVELLVAAWNPADPDKAERVYEAPVHADSVTGRKVYVFPATYTSEPASRGEDLYTHRVVFLVVEKYAGDGRPPVAWVDARVDFVWERVYQAFDFSHDGPLKFDGRSVVTRSTDPVDVYDAGYLVKNKVFWAEVTFEFDEALPA